MSMNDLSLRAFSQALADKVSVPGGGGASAAVGALGSALNSMVGNFTVGTKKYADVEADIIRLMEEADSLRNQLLECIDEHLERPLGPYVHATSVSISLTHPRIRHECDPTTLLYPLQKSA